jgi:hypothetical protein
MALLLPHSIFFHIPKTGGTWVREAVRAAGIPANEVFGELGSVEIDRYGLFHAKPRELKVQGQFTFAFIRHPLSLYQSHWAYKCRLGPDYYNDFDRQCMSEDFGEFVRNAVKMGPWVSSEMREYLGYDAKMVDFIGKQERLADDLVEALRRAGESFDEAALRSVPRVNESSALRQWKDRCVYTPELRTLVCENEYWMLDVLGYDETVPSGE